MSYTLVLVDTRTGNNKQAIALAESIKRNYKIDYVLHYIQYNFFSKLPNILLRKTGIHVQNKLSVTESPRLIISASRKSAAYALSLKKTFPHSKFIQIMNPELPFKEFDLVLLPYHDRKHHDNSNVIHIVGALNDVKHILSTQDDARSNYPQLDNAIDLVIGGSSNKFTFLYEDAIRLGDLVHKLAIKYDCHAFITLSRRTPKKIRDYFLRKFSQTSNIVCDPNTKDLNYPIYPHGFAYAKLIIVTGDSISMCSEAMAAEKPLYIYIPQNLKSRKHLGFIKYLEQHGMAKILDENINIMQKFHYNAEDQLTKITYIVGDKLNLT